MKDEHKLLPLEEYDFYIVSYSGGKDSLACLLHLLELGVDRNKIRLWHQHVDGEPSSEAKNGLMDWPVTESYVNATGKAFSIPVRYQWKHGGFEREMLRKESLTAPASFELEDGGIGTAGGKRGKLNTRRLFPQVSADLSVRWCSAYLKIDVAKKAIANDPAFNGKKVLMITGERREESAARAKYAEVERHATSGKKRRVDQWRMVIDWTEQEVWAIIERWRVNPHPAYYAGWGRVSCMACIFGDKDQWASVRKLDPERFDKIANYEAEFGKTIKRSESVIDQAENGQVFIRDWVSAKQAMSRDKMEILLADGEDWKMPDGAYKRCGGPV